MPLGKRMLREAFARLHPLHRRRNRTEYPDLDTHGVNEDDARQALETARAVVDAAKRLINSGRLDPFL
jgi:HEPN domain-containing protein